MTNKLKALTKKHGKAKLCELLGICRKTLYNWEKNGIPSYRVFQINQLASEE